MISNNVATNKTKYYTEHPCTLQQNKQQAEEPNNGSTYRFTNQHQNLLFPTQRNERDVPTITQYYLMELLISYKMKLLTRSFVILSDRVSNFLNGKNSDARMSLPCSLAMFAFSKSTLVFDRNFYSELEFEMVAFSLSPLYHV